MKDVVALGIKEISENKQKELESLFEDYSNAIQLVNLFIEVNNLDYDEVWDKANQQYDSDISYVPESY